MHYLLNFVDSYATVFKWISAVIGKAETRKRLLVHLHTRRFADVPIRIRFVCRRIGAGTNDSLVLSPFSARFLLRGEVVKRGDVRARTLSHLPWTTSTRDVRALARLARPIIAFCSFPVCPWANHRISRRRLLAPQRIAQQAVPRTLEPTKMFRFAAAQFTCLFPHTCPCVSILILPTCCHLVPSFLCI